MPATILQIADALTAALNGETFDPSFTAERLYQPIFTLEEMATLHVSVMPKTRVRSASNRSQYQYDYAVDVAIQKKTDRSKAQLDALVDLTEAVSDFLARSELAGATCIDLVNDPVFDPEHLEELGQFTSLLTLTYRGWR